MKSQYTERSPLGPDLARRGGTPPYWQGYDLRPELFPGSVPAVRGLSQEDTRMNGLMVKFDKAGAGKHVSQWKKRMDRTIRRAVKASRRAIHTMNNS